MKGSLVVEGGTDVGILDGVQQGLQPRSEVGIGSINNIFFGLVDRSGGVLAEGETTSRAESDAVTEGSLTLRTLFETRFPHLVVFAETVLVENLPIHLFFRNVGVDFELAAIRGPSSAMLNFLLREAVTNPLSDRRFSEVVGGDFVFGNLREGGNLFQSTVEMLVRERAVTVSLPSTEIDEEWSLGIVLTGTIVQPIGNVGLAPSERKRTRSSLRSVGIRVERHPSSGAGQIDGSDSEAGDGRDALCRVGEHGDECSIAGVRSSFEELIEFLLSQEIIRIYVPVGAMADFDVFRPITALESSELPEGLAVVPQCPLSHPVFVLVVEEEIVKVALLHLRQRDVGPLSGESELAEMVCDGTDVDTLRILVPSKSPDGFSIGFLDIGLGQKVELPLEFGLNVLDIIDICHSLITIQCRDCSVMCCDPGGTTFVDPVFSISGVCTERLGRGRSPRQSGVEGMRSSTYSDVLR